MVLNVSRLPSQIKIGYAGENEARPIEIDWTRWATLYGAGTLTILMQRRGDEYPYPIMGETEGTQTTWNPSSTDTAKTGAGKIQLRYSVGEVIAKTAIIDVMVGDSLGQEGTPPEPYEALIDEITDLVVEAQGSAENAAQSASEARGYATDAQSAKTAAETAQTRAETAQTRAESAQTASESARDTAVASATSAGQSAESAGASASSAESSASSAASSATSAGQYATSAGESATSASGSASSASQSATQASQSASSASQSATSASGSASSASASATAAATSESNASQSAQSASTSATSAEASAESAAQSASEALETLLDTAPVITDTASGAIASFSDGADGRPVVGLSVAIEPMQSGSGDPSPDNIRPITGHTSATVTRCGRNLLAFTPGETNTHKGVTYTGNDDYTITVSGTATATSFGFASVHQTLKAGTYTLSASNATGVRSVVVYGSSNKFVDGDGSTQFTLDSDMDVYAYCRVANGITVSTTPLIQIEPGSTAHAYEPYQVQTITIPFGQTVYGGTVDVVGGVLTVDRAINVIDGTQALTDNGIQAYGGVQVRYIPSPAKKPADTPATQNSGLLSDKFSTSLAYTDSAYQLTGRSTNAYVYFNMPSTVTTVNEAKAWFASNNTQISYKLATPIEIPLTANQLTTLLGDNNIWSDAGNTTVEYRADTKKYIQKMIAAALSA